MNLTEARHTQTLLNWILGTEEVLECDAIQAANYLAIRSYRRTEAGVGPHVTTEWMTRRPVVVRECPDVIAERRT